MFDASRFDIGGMGHQRGQAKRKRGSNGRSDDSDSCCAVGHPKRLGRDSPCAFLNILTAPADSVKRTQKKPLVVRSSDEIDRLSRLNIHSNPLGSESHGS
jgi:hypothetical protein